MSPDASERATVEFTRRWTTPTMALPQATVMLIDERTLSQASTPVVPRAANGTRFVRLAHHGANGDVNRDQGQPRDDVRMEGSESG